MGLCREIYQEGLRIPAVKIVRAGAINQDVMQIILTNVQTPKERAGDLQAQIGVCRVGEQRLLELVDKYQSEQIRVLSRELVEY